MAETLSSPAVAPDPRRRRTLFRAHHRGIKEMDIVMGRFADAAVPTMSEGELAEFERLLEAPDTDVFAWIVGRARAPAEFNTPVLHRIQAFHSAPGTV